MELWFFIVKRLKYLSSLDFCLFGDKITAQVKGFVKYLLILIDLLIEIFLKSVSCIFSTFILLFSINFKVLQEWNEKYLFYSSFYETKKLIWMILLSVFVLQDDYVEIIKISYKKLRLYFNNSKLFFVIQSHSTIS